MLRRLLLRAGSGAALLALVPHAARAQSRYPDRPIRVVVPFAPGRETNLIGRLWAANVQSQRRG